MTAYNDLSGFQFRSGKGYDRRSVEQFRALALGAVDELLRETTVMRDQLEGGGPVAAPPTLTAEEEMVLGRFRRGDSEFRQFMMLATPASVAAAHTAPPPSIAPEQVPQPDYRSAPSMPSMPPSPGQAPVEQSWGIAPPEPAVGPTPHSPAAADPFTPQPPAEFEPSFPLSSEFEAAPSAWNPAPLAPQDEPAGLPSWAIENDWATGTANDMADAEPEWLSQLRGEAAPEAASPGVPQGQPSVGWFVEDAFEGDVPHDMLAEQRSAAAFETVVPDVFEAPSFDAAPVVDPASFEAVPVVDPTPFEVAPFEPASFDANPFALSSFDANPFAAAPVDPNPFDAVPFDPSSLDAVAASAAPSALGASPDLPPPPPVVTDQHLDELFNQLDFGPPPAEVFEAAGGLMPHGGSNVTPAAGLGAPLHVERPTGAPGELPTAVAPWSGWIQT